MINNAFGFLEMATNCVFNKEQAEVNFADSPETRLAISSLKPNECSGSLEE
jgi:hypothetical protein